jgi:RNA polymerase sigma factor (sigma-70 family)
MIIINKGKIVTDVDSIIKYINEIKNIPVLTKDEEFEICQRIKSGDQSAISQLVKHNLRFVIHTAKKYQNLGLRFEDLISFGNIGLYRAAEKFDVDRGFKFITFAIWYVKAEITQALNELSNQVRIPNSQDDEDFQFNNIEGDVSTSDLDSFDKSDLMIELKMILKSLSDIEYDAITRFYGFGHQFSQSIDDISEHLGVSNERARQIIRKSERKLKSHPNLDILRKYLD